MKILVGPTEWIFMKFDQLSHRISQSSGGVIRRKTPEMNVSRGVHNHSIFVLIPTPCHLRVTVLQRQQQNRKNQEIHTS